MHHDGVRAILSLPDGDLLLLPQVIQMLKPLSEIAFDAYQCFADNDDRYPPWQHLDWKERLIFERIASRVEAEVIMRATDILKDTLKKE